MISKKLASFLCAGVVLLLSVDVTSSLPTLYDVMNEGDIAPLMPGDGYGYGYVRERKASAAPAEKGATVTQYVMEELFSGLAMPISSGVLDQTTLLPGAVTRTYTMDQGASTLHISAPASVITTAGYPIRIRGFVKDCSLDLEKKEGVCVEQVQLPMVTVFTDPATTATSTFTSTYTATYTRPLETLSLSSGTSMFTTANVRSSVFVGMGLLIGMMMA